MFYHAATCPAAPRIYDRMHDLHARCGDCVASPLIFDLRHSSRVTQPRRRRINSTPLMLRLAYRFEEKSVRNRSAANTSGGHPGLLYGAICFPSFFFNGFNFLLTNFITRRPERKKSETSSDGTFLAAFFRVSAFPCDNASFHAR